MRRALFGDVLEIIAGGDRPADHQKQDLRQRMRDTPRLARIGDLLKSPLLRTSKLLICYNNREIFPVWICKIRAVFGAKACDF